MFVRLNRRGAALPLTIIVIALMAVAVAISYHRLSAERSTTGDSQAQVDAFAVAQSGLNSYMEGLGSITVPPTFHDTTITGLSGGSARVTLRRLKDSVMTTVLLPAVYVLTSKGSNTTAKRYGSRTPPAERTVATYALWTPAVIDVDAAITSLGGMDKSGGAGAMSGVDECGAQAAIPGVAVPTGTYTGPTGPIDGNPDNTPVGLGTPGAGGTAKDEVDVDWAGIVAGTYLPPDFVYPSWPTAGQFNNWPIVRINNNPGAEFVLPSDGKGILIVTGDLRLNGSTANWQGLILAGGRIRSNGNNTASGAVIAGLNVKLGQAVLPSDMNGTKQYRFNSCMLTRAMSKIGSLQRVRNGWTDAWSSY